MPLGTLALHQIQMRLPKVVDARTHGIVDYCHATFFLGMALVCRKKNPPAALAALITGTSVLMEALLTDYPLGLKPLIPFEVHGKMDAGFAAGSYFIPKLFGFEGTKASAIFKANMVMESTAVALTDFNSQHARNEEHQG